MGPEVFCRVLLAFLIVFRKGFVKGVLIVFLVLWGFVGFEGFFGFRKTLGFLWGETMLRRQPEPTSRGGAPFAEPS